MASQMRKIVQNYSLAFRIRYGILIGSIAFHIKAQWILLYDPIGTISPKTWARLDALSRDYAWWRLRMDRRLGDCQ